MIKKFFAFLAIATIAFGACKDENDGPTLQLGNKPAITTPSAGASFVLKENEAANLFSDFAWTAAQFGFDAGVNYKLQIDKAGNGFADAVTLGNVNALNLGGVTIETINNMMLAKDLPEAAPSEMELRLIATVSPEVDPVYSDVVKISITPYASNIQPKLLQVPGNYQNWNPADATTVIFSPKANNKYEGYINFPNANTEFKYTDGPSWTVNWGDNGADGTLEKDGANIKAATAGLYKLNVNVTELTHTFTRTDWGLIGSATADGWNSDQDMTYDPADGTLKITTDLVAGEVKFRANDEWAINLGDDNANKILEYNGANIAIPDAGNYTIQLILNVPKYTYKITKN